MTKYREFQPAVVTPIKGAAFEESVRQVLMDNNIIGEVDGDESLGEGNDEVGQEESEEA